MSLPRAAIEFVYDNAESNGVDEPGRNDDLFKIGALDSFALVDFVTVLEEHCGITVPDVDVNPANFRTIESIERYVESRRAEQ